MHIIQRLLVVNSLGVVQRVPTSLKESELNFSIVRPVHTRLVGELKKNLHEPPEGRAYIPFIQISNATALVRG